MAQKAVKTQGWVAITVFVLVAILKKQLGLDRSLYEILQCLSLTIFEKSPISLAFSQYKDRILEPDPRIQLDLVNL